MLNSQPRKTSVPINFTFGRRRPSQPRKDAPGTRITPPQIEKRPALIPISGNTSDPFTFARTRPSQPQKDAPGMHSAPPQIETHPALVPIPYNTSDHRQLPTAVQPLWTPVEIADFPPTLRRAQLLELLKWYLLSPGIDFPNTMNFSRPFRITVLAAGIEEAEKLVRELNGKNVNGRKISVRMVANRKEGDRGADIQNLADEMKTEIINTARMYYASLADAILEVRELVKDGSHFAFLQKRTPVTASSNPEAHALDQENKAEWEFVAGAAVDPKTQDGNVVPQLEALKSLRSYLEGQGVLGKIWSNWDGSQALVARRT